MLVVGENTAAPEIRYPFGLKVWHAIYIGLLPYSVLQVRLKSDSTFCRITQQHEQASYNRIEDLFWKCADLTGQEIVFGQFCRQVVPDNATSVGNPCEGAWVGYIKLIPLAEEEVRAVEADRRHTETRCLFAHNDAWSYTLFSSHDRG